MTSRLEAMIQSSDCCLGTCSVAKAVQVALTGHPSRNSAFVPAFDRSKNSPGFRVRSKAASLQLSGAKS
jgi:hypothetical protein